MDNSGRNKALGVQCMVNEREMVGQHYALQKETKQYQNRAEETTNLNQFWFNAGARLRYWTRINKH